MTCDRGKTSAGWCCTDCLMLLANGEIDPSWPEEEAADYLARVDRRTAGDEVTWACSARITTAPPT